MKIGLVGEAPNDTLSIQNLLKKRYSSDEYEYVSMLDRINGSQLESQKTKRFLRIEYEIKRPDLIVFIRDLDSILPNREKLAQRKEYFRSFNSVVDKKGLYLLNIYEIEALILADIETFNEIYNFEVPHIEDPMSIEEPKEYLKTLSSIYNESQNPEVFNALDFKKMNNCQYFSLFILKLDEIIKSKSY